MFEENDRQRADKLIAAFLPSQKERWADIRQTLHIEIATKFGDRIAPIVIDDLLTTAVLDGDVMTNCVGSDVASKNFAAIVDRIVGNHEMAQRSITSSDKAMRDKLRTEYPESLSPQNRMNLGRDKNAQAIITTAVDAALEQKILNRLN